MFHVEAHGYEIFLILHKVHNNARYLNIFAWSIIHAIVPINNKLGQKILIIAFERRPASNKTPV